MTRAFEAGPDGLELLAFGGGAGGVQDAEVVPDWWPTGTSSHAFGTLAAQTRALLVVTLGSGWWERGAPNS